jgi:catechol 2,3-dioxygenase-like lactoylglutathione lyase family enzyme
VDYKHVALVVPDLRVAETFYRVTFDMTVLGREAWGEDGEARASSRQRMGRRHRRRCRAAFRGAPPRQLDTCPVGR